MDNTNITPAAPPKRRLRFDQIDWNRAWYEPPALRAYLGKPL